MASIPSVEAGDLVLVTIPFVNSVVAARAMLGLVVRIIDTDRGQSLIVAKGATQKVCAAGHPSSEVVLTEPLDLERSGLRQPTRFDLADRIRTQPSLVRRIGRFPMHNRRHANALFRALMAAEHRKGASV